MLIYSWIKLFPFCFDFLFSKRCFFRDALAVVTIAFLQRDAVSILISSGETREEERERRIIMHPIHWVCASLIQSMAINQSSVAHFMFRANGSMTHVYVYFGAFNWQITFSTHTPMRVSKHAHNRIAVAYITNTNSHTHTQARARGVTTKEEEERKKSNK